MVSRFFFPFFFAFLPFFPALNPLPGIDLHLSRLLAIFLFFLWGKEILLKKVSFFPFRMEIFLFGIFFFLSGFSLFFAEHLDWGIRKLLFLLSFSPLLFLAHWTLRTSMSRDRFVRWLVIGSAFSAFVGIVQCGSTLFLELDPVMRFWQETLLPFFGGKVSAETITEYSSMVVALGGHNILRASAFFPDPHIASLFWGMTFPFAVMLAWQARGISRGGYAALAGIILFADMLTFSRGGIFALVCVSFFLLLWFGKQWFHRKIGWIFLFIFCLLSLIFIPNPLSERFLSSFDREDGSVASRLTIWRETLDILQEYPITGVGLGNYSNTVKPSATYREPRYAHNLFLDIAGESGIPAAIAFFGVFGVLFWRYAPFLSQPLVLATILSLGIFLIHSLFETPIYSVHILPLLFALVGMASREDIVS